MKSYCSLRNSARKWKTAHGPLARNSAARQAVMRTRSRNRPMARLPSEHAPRARPPCGPRRKSAQRGPLALSASRAPDRNLGLGRESLIPPGLNLGPVSVSRPSQSDGCTRFPAEQNRARRPHANPSLILSLPRSLSHAAASDSKRPTSGGGESDPEAPPEPLAGVRAHRWVNAPPSSGLYGASTRSLAPTRWRASAPSRSRRRRRSTRVAPTRSRTRPHVDEWWSGSTRAARRSMTRGSAVDGDCEETR
jgi:hypothetical protein